MIVVNTDFVPGHRIRESVGLVRGSTIRAKHLGKDLLAGLRTIVGGEISTGKGLNVPGSDLSIGALTDKDRRDLEFGIEIGVDFIGLSFVRSAVDILEGRSRIGDCGAAKPIVADTQPDTNPAIG